MLHLLKGTVRPDWICMRVVPLDMPCYVRVRYVYYAQYQYFCPLPFTLLHNNIKLTFMSFFAILCTTIYIF